MDPAATPMVTIEHPALTQPAQVARCALPAWKRAGWHEQTVRKAPRRAPAPQPTPAEVDPPDTTAPDEDAPSTESES